MDTPLVGPSDQQTLERVLGYLNFSSGAPDPQFLSGLNRLFDLVETRRQGSVEQISGTGGHATDADTDGPWRSVGRLLRDGLDSLRSQSPAFRDADQAGAVLDLVFEHTLPSYLAWHPDLLFHQTAAILFHPLMVGRVCEAVLQQGPPWEEAERVVQGAIHQLNDYIGHRPVASLETQKIEPYLHEWCRPVPLYVEGCGIGVGRYHDVVEMALRLLDETDDDILRDACFDPRQLEELAFDPRAYDFEHPVNRRPNYHFGQWDPHQIDNKGFFRRFVVQQVMLDALMQRLVQGEEAPHDELLFEAGAVLAGTILMGSGVSGSGPDTHDSGTTLARLLPRIAAYRDEFYARLLRQIGGGHAKRLKAEAAELRQPFGAARQHLNAQLAHRRASQMEHVHLAKIFARMGHPEAAMRQADVVPTASARMLCRIDCRLAAAKGCVRTGELRRALATIGEIMDILHRAIDCGAVIDPWNIIGFDAHFSLFPALENSIHDHRADDLIALMERILALMSWIWSEAAAVEDRQLCEEVSAQLDTTAQWWHRFAVHEVSSVEGTSALDIQHAARRVAQALGLWHQGGAAAGDVRFWAPHAEMFDSPQAYASVIEALLERGDFVASMALLIAWLEQADRIGLEKGDSSFHRLAQLWMRRLWRLERGTRGSPSGSTGGPKPVAPHQRWSLACRFLDSLEANAENYWDVPQFDPAGGGLQASDEDRPLVHNEDNGGGSDEDDEPEDPFGAAYENVVYRDSTDDGFDGDVFDLGQPSEDQFQRESKRIISHLAFLDGLAQLWRLAATGMAQQLPGESDGYETMGHWFSRASVNQTRLTQLGETVHRHRIPRPSGDQESMVQYDRERMLKEMLLERIISTSVNMADAGRFMLAAVATQPCAKGGEPRWERDVDLEHEQRQAIVLCQAVFRGDADAVRAGWADFIKSLDQKPLLYLPFSKGGDPRQIVAARVRQRILRDLLAWLPRLGLLTEACRLIEIARELERQQPVGPGAVTEFDEIFEIGYRAVVNCLVTAAESWQPGDTATRQSNADTAHELVACLEQVTRTLLISWLAHSRVLWLSVLERVKEEKEWRRVVAFIRRYGSDLFTQHFLNIGNLRAILHEGVDAWLTQLEEDPQAETPRFIEHINGDLSRSEAVEHLTLILQAVVENYNEYIDYNSTTTQSDKGELLYTLLDFLRLRNEYDRVAWHLKPVVLAHEILLRRGHDRAAKMWRQELARQIDDEADKFLNKLARLQKKYAMHMRTVADRVNERFLRPLAIDRIRSLVEPAMREANAPGESTAFQLLQRETQVLTEEPSGVGFDLPAWLDALEEEVDRVCGTHHDRDELNDVENMIPQVELPLAEVKKQLTEGDQQQAL